MSGSKSRAGRTLILAGSSIAAAEEFARRAQIEDPVILPKAALAKRESRRLARGAARVILHTASWRVQRHPQVLALALLVVPTAQRYVADDEVGEIRRIRTSRLLRTVALMPIEIAFALTRVLLETARFVKRRNEPPLAAALRPSTEAPALLAIWIGEPGVAVGGSITHISGILAGFRRHGYRIGLVTAVAPPPQLAAVVDDVERALPVPAGARISHDLACLALNDPVRAAAERLAARVRPQLVYQRHHPYILAGVDAAAALGLPLVLEWNASEAWARANWQRVLPLEGRLAPLLEAMERTAARRASLVAAVSEEAARMALEAGASPERVLVVPNGVDWAALEAGLERRSAALHTGDVHIGWIGSFGPWHGADVLVRALAALPAHVRAVLVGDGSCRPTCERLAAELGVADRVEFTGVLAHRAALQRMAECDVLVAPHVQIPGRRFFGSPTKLYEYMALGRPIVASDLDQIGDVLDHGRTARLVPPGDPSALAAAIEWIASNPEQGRLLGEAARSDAHHLHTWQRRAGAILEGLREPEPLAASSRVATIVPLTRRNAASALAGRVRTTACAAFTSRTSRQAAAFVCAAVLVNLVAGAKKIVLARALSGAAFAGYAFAGSALGLLALAFEFGLLMPVSRAVARETEPARRRELVGAALLLFLPVGCACAGAVAALSFVTDGLFHVQAGRALLIISPLAIAVPFQQLALWLTQGLDRLHLYSLTVAAAQLGVALALAGLIVTGARLSLPLVLTVELGTVAVSWLLLVARLRPRLVHVGDRARELISASRKFGFHMYVGRLLSMGTYNMDILLVAALTNGRAAALYAIAGATARTVSLPMTGFGNALFPRLARDGRLARRWLVGAWATGLVTASILSAVASPLIVLLFSSAYAVGPALLAPLAFAEAIRAVTTLYNVALSAQGRGRELRSTALVLTASNLALNFTLIPAFGVVGAAWASLLALAANYTAHIVFYRRSVRLSAPPAALSEAA